MNWELINTSLRKPLGWFLFILSGITFILALLTPWLNASTPEKLATAGSLYLASQISWWLCIPLLGTDFLRWGKQAWARIKPASKRQP